MVKNPSKNGSKLLKDIWKSKYTYLFILPSLVFVIIFSYIPLYGITLAFKEYKINLGILGSPWIGFQKFELLFSYKDFFSAMFNTVIISFGRILFEFPVPIILAILLFELRLPRYGRTLQTIYTFPNFFSWVIVAGVLKNFLRLDGFINQILATIGIQPIPFLLSEDWFKPILFITDCWKGMGWSAIIYLAALTSINTELFDAATVDGANRLQRTLHITIPCISPTIILCLVLSLASILSGGFDQIFNLINPVVKNAGQILDTYIYSITFEQKPDFGLSTAMGLFTGVISFALLLSADKVIRMMNGKGLYTM